MRKVLVRYFADGAATIGDERLVKIHPADEIKAKRELAGKPAAYVDDEVRLYTLVYLAERRAGNVTAAFDQWIETVAEVEPRLSEKQVDDAVIAGEIPEDVAERLKAQIREQESAEGESLTPLV